jgi:hypothetical protein
MFKTVDPHVRRWAYVHSVSYNLRFGLHSPVRWLSAKVSEEHADSIFNPEDEFWYEGGGRMFLRTGIKPDYKAQQPRISHSKFLYRALAGIMTEYFP